MISTDLNIIYFACLYRQKSTLKGGLTSQCLSFPNFYMKTVFSVYACSSTFALDTVKNKCKRLLVPLVLEFLLMLVWCTSSLPCVSAYASVVFVDMS